MRAIFLRMRTTIELPNDLRARLLEVAARRGEKGFSGLVREAVAQYLAELDSREARLARAAQVLGSVTKAEAEEMRRVAHSIRERWR